MGRETLLKCYRENLSEELNRYLRSTNSSLRCLKLSYRGLTREEVEQLFDKYIEEKKNVDPKKDELGQGNRTKIGQGKSEVFHEVQD